MSTTTRSPSLNRREVTWAWGSAPLGPPAMIRGFRVELYPVSNISCSMACDIRRACSSDSFWPATIFSAQISNSPSIMAEAFWRMRTSPGSLVTRELEKGSGWCSRLGIRSCMLFIMG